MPRELTEGRLTKDGATAAKFLCRARHGAKSMQLSCDVCYADIVRLVDGGAPAPGSEALDALNRLHVAASCAADDEDSPIASTDGGCYTLSGDYQTVYAALSNARPASAGPPTSGEDELREWWRAAEEAHRLNVLATVGHRFTTNLTAEQVIADYAEAVRAHALSRLPAAAPPEVTSEDVHWLKREAAGPTLYAQEWIDSAAEHTHRPLADHYARILAAVEYVAALNGGNDG